MEVEWIVTRDVVLSLLAKFYIQNFNLLGFYISYNANDFSFVKGTIIMLELKVIGHIVLFSFF